MPFQHPASRLPFFFLVGLLLTLTGCHQKNPVQIFKADKTESRDSTIAWLRNADNFHRSDYYAVFDSAYQSKLRIHRYTAAGELLDAVAEKEMFFLEFDSTFAARLNDFQESDARRLPWNQTQFIHSHHGYTYMESGDFRQAIAFFRAAVRHYPVDYESCMETANAFCDMAFCYSSVGNQEQALRCNYRALHYFGLAGSETGRGIVYDNIALVHLFTRNYSEAEEYFDKAMKVYKHLGDTSNMFNTLHNSILLYEETNNRRRYELIDSAYRFLQSARLDDPSLEVSIKSLYVEKLLHDKEFTTAHEIIRQLEPIVEELSAQNPLQEYNVALAQYQIASGIGILDTAVIQEALRTAEDSQNLQQQVTFAGVLKDDAIMRKDYFKALEYSEKEKKAINDLAARDMSVRTAELNKRHQLEAKESRIALQERKIESKNSYIALLIASIGFFVLIVLVVYIRTKQKKILADARQTRLYTHRLLEKTEEERKRIASDLHDSVSHELLNLKRDLEPENNVAGSKIDAIIEDIRVISRNLHPVMFEKIGLAANVEQLVERTREAHNLMVHAEINYDGRLSVADELQIYRIVQEAINNTVKYAQAIAAKITIQSLKDELIVEIKDNGIGFDVAQTISGNDAFGLHNISERTRAIGGIADISSNPAGTVILLKIPRTS